MFPVSMPIRAERSGMTMVETIVALGILAVVGATIVAILTVVLSLGTTAMLRNRAVGYGEANLERVRGYFQTYLWAGLADKAQGGSCYGDGTLAGQLAGCPGTAVPPGCVLGQAISGTSFSGYVRLTRNGDSIFVQIFTGWPDKGTCENLEMDTYYFNY